MTVPYFLLTIKAGYRLAHSGSVLFFTTQTFLNEMLVNIIPNLLPENTLLTAVQHRYKNVFPYNYKTSYDES